MNILVFLSRLWPGFCFLMLAAMSDDPSFFKKYPEYHPSTAAQVASLFLAIVYTWPLLLDAKNRKVITRRPTKRSFTSRRFLIFSRWYLLFFFALLTIVYFWYFQFFAGMLAIIALIMMLPPCDRLQFASKHELAAFLGSDMPGLKVFPNMAVFTYILALGCLLSRGYTAMFVNLLLTIGFLLVIPLVLVKRKGWKALLLKSEVLPVVIQQPVFDTSATISSSAPKKYLISTQRLPSLQELRSAAQQKLQMLQTSQGPLQSQEPLSKFKYYSAQASNLDWPLPYGLKRHPLDEPTFNLLIRGFETSWLESKDYYQRKSRHRNLLTLLHELISEAEAYLRTMRSRVVLQGQSKLTTAKTSGSPFAPDEISKFWKENKKSLSLYQASRQFAETPQENTLFRSFQDMAPHIAEYRAMINVVKHLIHTMRRLPQPESTPSSTPATTPGTPKVITPAPTPVPLQSSTQVPPQTPTPVSIQAPPQTAPLPPPTVFISYSWDSPEHEKWIVGLATKLRENGVDAILDKWDLGPLGKPLPHFMETSIARAQRVICIMTPNYKKKTENLTGGVGYEYSIITAAIFADDITTSKFIPLFRSGAPADAIPTALAGRRYVDMRDDAQFEEKFVHELLRDIHDEPRFKKPAIGKKPQF